MSRNVNYHLLADLERLETVLGRKAELPQGKTYEDALENCKLIQLEYYQNMFPGELCMVCRKVD